MDDYTIENWRKIKTALEAADKTDSFFYKRAVAIVRGQDDPLEFEVKKEQDESTSA